MIVVFSENFSTQLDELIAFIANDSLQKANKFDKVLFLHKFQLKCSKSWFELA